MLEKEARNGGMERRNEVTRRKTAGGRRKKSERA